MPVPTQTPQQDSTQIIASAISSLKETTDSIVASQTNDRKALETITKENTMLRMNIQRMKQNHSESRFFTENNEGVAFCIESNGTRPKTIRIGVISIAKAQNYKIFKNGNYTDYIFVTYYDSKRFKRNAIFTEDELTNKKILKYFHGFECECKSKQLANDYLASRIHDIKPGSTSIINEYPGFAPFINQNNIEKAHFICNSECIPPEILRLFSPNIINRRLPNHQKNITEIKSAVSAFLDAPEKCLLFTFNICGILSSLLNEIGYDMEQFLVISSTDYNDTKYASMYLKLYDRNKPSLSFDDSKPMIQKVFSTSRDETIVISECTNIDNQSRRKDMLKLILSLDSQAQPHNTAIISTAAQYILSSEKKICMTLSRLFPGGLTPEEENNLFNSLNDISRHFIDFCCNQYSDIKSDLIFSISFLFNETNQQNFQNIQCLKSWCILLVVFEMFKTYYDIPFSTKEFKNYLYHTLNISFEKTGGNSEAIVNDFTQALNEVIRNHNVEIISYSKNMNFTPGNNEIILKDNMLAMEEETLIQKILPLMTTTNSVLHVLQSLNEDNLLYTSSKGEKESLRYKLTVYSHGMSRRYSFIAMEKDGILDNDNADMLSGIKTSEWFAKILPTTPVIPIITNQNGFIASQEFAANRQDNLHFFTTGLPDYGKTHHLTERMCSLQKQGIRTVVFDVSGSFTKDEIIEKLSVDGDDKILNEVENYVNEHITFHNIETEDIPVEPLTLHFSDDITEKKNILFSIIMSHFGSFGKVQEVFMAQLIANLIATNNLSIMNAYNHIVNVDYPEEQYTLYLQIKEHFSCFKDYKCVNRGWDEFLDNSKDIIIISMNASSKTGGYALIDILMMSLFYHQRFNPAKHLGIFVDEIHSQNLKPQGPITQILREGRKFRTFLNYATQFLSKKNTDANAVIKLAGMSAFFNPDDTSALAVSKSLGISQKELVGMNVGECFIKGDVYNYQKQIRENKVLHGRTYRNFVPFK
ncbi:MAG: hypothetical protein K2I80_00585 [Ruminococcus sp.]|nr:hypothetical protein [Ruminococcus sp.]